MDKLQSNADYGRQTKRSYTILYKEKQEDKLAILGQYNELVAYALIQEFERSGILLEYREEFDSLVIRKPVYVRLALDVEIHAKEVQA